MQRYLRRSAAIAASLLFLFPAAGQTVTDHVRVRLFDGRDVSSVVLVASGEAMTLFAQPDADAITVVQPGDSVAVRPGPLGLQVRAGDLDIRQDELHARVSEKGAIDVHVYDDGRGIVRRYPGTIDVRTAAGGRLHVTNTVPIETYVASVVGKEYGLDDQEGSRAMAVVARTFAVRTVADDNGDAGDGIRSQVYHGLDAMSNAAREAADATRGKILTHDDRPIVAVYSASNGGHSAKNSDVWSGEPLPYLRARKDRFDRAASPYKDWLSRLEQDRVHNALSEFTSRTVTGFSVDSRSRDGRVRDVNLRVEGAPEITISGSEFRRVIAGRLGATVLRSTLFEVDREGDHYVFEGSGYGHGVGLSQWGAHEMANRGYNYEEILRFYYPGAEIQSMDALGFEVGAPVVAADPDPDVAPPSREYTEPTPGRKPTHRGDVRSWTASPTTPRASSSGQSRVGW